MPFADHYWFSIAPDTIFNASSELHSNTLLKKSDISVSSLHTASQIAMPNMSSSSLVYLLLHPQCPLYSKLKLTQRHPAIEGTANSDVLGDVVAYQGPRIHGPMS